MLALRILFLPFNLSPLFRNEPTCLQMIQLSRTQGENENIFIAIVCNFKHYIVRKENIATVVMFINKLNVVM